MAVSSRCSGKDPYRMENGLTAALSSRDGDGKLSNESYELLGDGDEECS